MKLFARSPAGLALLVSLFLVPCSAVRAAPRDDLLRLVPEDVGFCLVLQDLRGYLERLQGSPFLESFRQSTAGKELRSSDETRKLLNLAEVLNKQLGLDFDQLRDEVFGDAILVADHPSPGDKPGDKYTLFLIRARNAELLADLVAKLNRFQEKQGELKKLEEREYRGQKYWRREEARQENFYFLKGPILVLASKEAALRRVIDRDLKAPADAESPLAKQFRVPGAERALLVLWINPRAYDADLQARLKQAKDSEALVLQTFNRYWKALEGIVLAVGWRKEFEATLSVRANTESLPPAARRYLAEASQPSDLGNRFPENALLAATGRVDWSALVEVISEFISPEEQKTLKTKLQGTLGASVGKDLTSEVLPALGPDWGFCIVAPPASDKGWFPHVILALRAGPGPNKDAPVDEALLSAIKSYATLAVVGHNQSNKEQMSLKSVMQDKVKVNYLESASFPAGLRPAFALSSGYLVLASSPEAVRRFTAGNGRAPAAAEQVVLRLSLKDLRAYVEERRESLAQAVAEKNQLTREEAERRLDDLLDGLKCLDRVEVTQRAAPGQVTWTLRLRPAQPLEK
jgi:hypothetical protein